MPAPTSTAPDASTTPPLPALGPATPAHWVQLGVGLVVALLVAGVTLVVLAGPGTSHASEVRDVVAVVTGPTTRGLDPQDEANLVPQLLTPVRYVHAGRVVEAEVALTDDDSPRIQRGERRPLPPPGSTLRLRVDRDGVVHTGGGVWGSLTLAAVVTGLLAGFLAGCATALVQNWRRPGPVPAAVASANPRSG